MAATFARSKERVEASYSWLLHSYPYKETSLIVEVFSREQGRVALVARGARRPASALRGSLMAFQPLALSWFGASDLKTLHAAEWQGGVAQLAGLPLICGFYLNELLIKLLPREDAHPGLFAAYDLAIRKLAGPDRIEVEPILRKFELTLLREIGYGVALDFDVDGQPVHRESNYRFLSGRGVVRTKDAGFDAGLILSGRTLIAMMAGNFADMQVAQQAKQLMRVLIGDLLGDTPLHTRNILRDLHKL
ncbi:DNA repair protein RecO [Chitinimonas sp. BJB300]|uniref:DNA repair protein RecO n=1 Tax=Chitinimonas sp. BJB300 TaxID=1559339 RepID=UPI000C0D282E|nr:DNA repair protein RecO [Chitinimonas sp. BJB300]PHV11571.1 DNA repair protein RecO [Chitinimonas sp. BJB300]TSJ88971.1 DNA repair protein RecO [Chitinimonas sp. BJB300]